MVGGGLVTMYTITAYPLFRRSELGRERLGDRREVGSYGLLGFGSAIARYTGFGRKRHSNQGNNLAAYREEGGHSCIHSLSLGGVWFGWGSSTAGSCAFPSHFPIRDTPISYTYSRKKICVL